MSNVNLKERKRKKEEEKTNISKMAHRDLQYHDVS